MNAVAFLPVEHKVGDLVKGEGEDDRDWNMNMSCKCSNEVILISLRVFFDVYKKFG